MKKATSFVLSSFLAVGIWAQAFERKWEADVEAGRVSSGYNDVRIPNVGGTLFSLSRDLHIANRPFFRLRLSRALGRRHTISILYAPLTLKAAGILPGDVSFQQTEFRAGTPVTGIFTFNSYRLTYRYGLIEKPKLRLGLGFTAKIRDAEIAIRSESRNASKTNVGFVPLFNLYLQWQWSDRWGLLMEADAAAAKQGRAEDVLLAVTFRLNDRLRLRGGYRFVEGGADVEAVYNFAWIHYLALGVTYSF